MKDLTPKVDTTTGPTGQYTAAEFNDLHDDAQNAVTGAGQALTVATGDDNEQLMKAIAVGGRRKSRADTETAEVGDIAIPDNSSGAVTINLPLLVDIKFINATVVFEPLDDSPYSTNSLTVGRNSQLIMGLAEDLVLDSVNSDNKIIEFSWKASTEGWVIKTLGDVGTTL